MKLNSFKYQNNKDCCFIFLKLDQKKYYLEKKKTISYLWPRKLTDPDLQTKSIKRSNKALKEYLIVIIFLNTDILISLFSESESAIDFSFATTCLSTSVASNEIKDSSKAFL